MPIQHLFISYSRSDAETALQLATQLKKAGVHIWLDQLDIPAGAVWDIEVEKALEACDCLLFIVSKASVSSTNVLNEVYYALEEGKRVLPVRINDCKIPFRIKRLHYIDLADNYEQGFGTLLKTLHGDDHSLTTALSVTNGIDAGKKKQAEIAKDVKKHTPASAADAANECKPYHEEGPSGTAKAKISSWVYISAAAFISSVIIAFLFMYFGQSLIGADKAIMYFLILIPLAICSAAFLFKAMKSYASLKGKYLDYNVELAGPVVLFCLVIGGGYWFYQHPPLLELFDLTILFRDENEPSKLLNGAVTIRYGTKTGSYDIKNGEAIFKQVESGKPVEISQKIIGYYNKGSNIYTVPKPGTPLNISVYQDAAVSNQKKMLLARISVSLNAYLNDAKTFRDMLIDTTLILSKNDIAFDSLVGAITHYNNSYLLLNTIKDSLNQANKTLIAVDTTSLNNIFKSFDYVHRGLFLRYNDRIRPALMTYITASKPPNEIRSEIVENIRDCIEKTRDDMLTLERLIPEIQKELKF